MSAVDEEFDDAVARELRRYIKRVTAALGLGGESSYVDAGPPANAYLALEGRLPSFPDQDVALLWDEEYGWSAAIEAPVVGQDRVVAYLHGRPVPPPAEVARFAQGLLRGERLGDPRPVRLATPGDHRTGLLPRLRAVTGAELVEVLRLPNRPAAEPLRLVADARPAAEPAPRRAG
ncbi:hypothetical protein GCM10009660_27020 [Catellatospora bangladeshensis]